MHSKRPRFQNFSSLRASSPIWASEASLVRTRERGAARVLARPVSLAQTGELARRLKFFQKLAASALANFVFAASFSLLQRHHRLQNQEA